MSNLVTGGLAGLVVVLALALWRKEQQGKVTGQAQRRNGRQPIASEAAATRKPSKPKKSKKKASKGASAEDDQAAPKATVTREEQIKAETKEGSRMAERDDSGIGAPAEASEPKKGKAAANAQKARQPAPAPKQESPIDSATKGSIQPQTGDAPPVERMNSNGTSVIDLSDYEVIDRAPRKTEQAWQNVGGKTRVAPNTTLTAKAKAAPASSWATSNPFAALPDGSPDSKAPRVVSINNTSTTKSTAVNGKSRAAEDSAPTKRQRQNAARTQAKKAEKDAQEAERQARLAQHKRQLQSERARAGEKRGAAPYSVPGPGAAMASGGGPRASINEKGSLVWD